MENRYQFPDSIPEMLTTFTITKTKPSAFLRMINNLTGPLMPISVEHRNTKYDAMEVFTKEAPLEATPMDLATDIVQYANSHLGRKVLKKLMYEC